MPLLPALVFLPLPPCYFHLFPFLLLATFLWLLQIELVATAVVEKSFPFLPFMLRARQIKVTFACAGKTFALSRSLPLGDRKMEMQI